MATSAMPQGTYDQRLRTALGFLASPWQLWISGRIEDRRAVLKLTSADRLRYKRGHGFRTANLSLPFRVLGDFLSGEKAMARLDGETSNALFETLADWNTCLAKQQADFGGPQP